MAKETMSSVSATSTANAHNVKSKPLMSFAALASTEGSKSIKSGMKAPASAKKGEDLRDSVIWGTPLRVKKRVRPSASTSRRSKRRMGPSSLHITPLLKPRNPILAAGVMPVNSAMTPMRTGRKSLAPASAARSVSRSRVAATPSLTEKRSKKHSKKKEVRKPEVLADQADISFEADPNALSEILSSDTNFGEFETPSRQSFSSSVFATPRDGETRTRRDSIVKGEPLRVAKKTPSRRSSRAPSHTPLRAGRVQRLSQSAAHARRMSVGKVGSKGRVSHVLLSGSAISKDKFVIQKHTGMSMTPLFPSFSASKCETPKRSPCRSPRRSPARPSPSLLSIGTTPKRTPNRRKSLAKSPFTAISRTPTAPGSIDFIRRLSMGIENVLNNPTKQFTTPKKASKKSRGPVEASTPLSSKSKSMTQTTPLALKAKAPATPMQGLQEELIAISLEELQLTADIAKMETPKRSRVMSPPPPLSA